MTSRLLFRLNRQLVLHGFGAKLGGHHLRVIFGGQDDDLNSAFVRQQAEAFADRLGKLTDLELLDHAWLSAFGRPPTTKERELANAFSFEMEAQNETSTSRQAALIALAQSLLCAAEFVVVD